MWKTPEESVNVEKIIWKRDTRYTFFCLILLSNRFRMIKSDDTD